MEQNDVNKSQRETVVFLFKAPKEEGKEDKYQEIFEKSGICSVIIPVLSFRYVNQDILRSSLSCIEEFSAIILTSVRAVDAVTRAIKNTSSDHITPLMMSSLQCFVVGQATEDAAQCAGFNPLGGHTGNGEALAHFILENLRDSTKPILFPCSSIHRDSIPDILCSKGLKLKEIVSYETCADENLTESLKSNILSKGTPDFVAFFSPSGFNFVHEIKDDIRFSLHNIKILAIGPATSQAIQVKGLSPFGTAVKPDPKSLLQLIKLDEQSIS